MVKFTLDGGYTVHNETHPIGSSASNTTDLPFCNCFQYGQTWSECLDKNVMAVDENNALEIKVYPNPTNGLLFVETHGRASLSDQTYQTYHIMNVTGQTLLSGQITNPTQPIDVSSLADGMYFVRIQCDGNSEMKKFCIAR